MKVRFDAVFKFYVVALVALLLWSVWASAADNSTNAPAKTNAPAQTYAFGTNVSAPDFGLSRIPALQERWFDIQIWQYIATIIYVLLAFGAAKLIDIIVRTRLKGWAAKTKTRVDDIIVTLVGGPIKIIVFVILLHVGLRLFPWPDFIEHYISKGLQVIVALSLTIVALKIVDLLLDYWRGRASAAEDRVLADQLLPFLRNAAKVFVVIVAGLLALETLGVKITGLIASLSVGGLAVGLAAQDTLANLFGAIAVFADKPFRVGEFVRIDQVEGTVEVIGMRSTRLRTPDGHLVAIPNKTVGNAVIINIARRPTIRTVMNIGVTYDTSAAKMQRATEVVREVYSSHPMTKEVAITFNRFDASSLNIELIHIWNGTDVAAHRIGLQQMNLQLKERFDQEKISFAYPTQTIHVRHLDGTPLPEG